MFFLEWKAQIKDLLLYPIKSSRLSQHPILVQKHWHENYSLDQSRSEWRQDTWGNQHWVIDIRTQVVFLQPLSHWRPSNPLFYTSCLSFPQVLADCLAHLYGQDFRVGICNAMVCAQTLSLHSNFNSVQQLMSKAETGWQRVNPKSPLPSISETNSLHFCHQLCHQQQQKSTPVLKCLFSPHASPSCFSNKNISSSF